MVGDIEKKLTVKNLVIFKSPKLKKKSYVFRVGFNSFKRLQNTRTIPAFMLFHTDLLDIQLITLSLE